MPNQTIATSVACPQFPATITSEQIDITVSLTCARNSRYPVCALEKDGAGFGDLILQTAQAAIRAVFFACVLLWAELMGTLRGCRFSVCAGSPTRKLLPALFGDR